MVIARPTSLEATSNEPSPDMACTGLPIALVQSLDQRSPQRLSVGFEPSTTLSISAIICVRGVILPSCSPARKTSWPVVPPRSWPRSTWPAFHDATPIFDMMRPTERSLPATEATTGSGQQFSDRKSTRLNSSHLVISYAVFCLKKKNKALILSLAYITLPTITTITNV